MNADLKRIGACEVCGNGKLTEVLNLGNHPLCDDLVPVGDPRVCREYPIEIMFCGNCRTAHQRYQVPKRELFPATYHYRARFTADVLNGMAGLVDSFEKRFGSLAGKKVLDIGCNDGSLLDYFRKKGATTTGIEPTDACQDAVQKGHAAYQGFLSNEVAERMVSKHGKPDVITFTNVFAHIENLPEVLAALRILMGPRTVIVVENHYLGSVFDGHQFDTFYHEHARTYSHTSFVHIARSLGMVLLDSEFPARYGGNIRVYMGGGSGAKVGGTDLAALNAREAGFAEEFASLRDSVERWRKTKRKLLEAQFERCGKIRAKAFPARAAILIKLLGMTADIMDAVYEKPGSLKIGHYAPATRIPIRSDAELFAQTDRSSPLLNMAWHIPKEIRGYLADQGYGGPVIDVVSAEDFPPRS